MSMRPVPAPRILQCGNGNEHNGDQETFCPIHSLSFNDSIFHFVIIFFLSPIVGMRAMFLYFPLYVVFRMVKGAF